MIASMVREDGNDTTQAASRNRDKAYPVWF